MVPAKENNIFSELPKSLRKRRSYLYAVGRRKTAVARVRYYKKGDAGLKINEMDVQTYFPTSLLQSIVRSPLDLIKDEKPEVLTSMLTIKVRGGGKHSQAEAVRHGIARVLLCLDDGLRPSLKKAGFLTRDSRRKERKKPGLKRARRAPQWSKR